jgi:hypothetical protein
MTSRKWWTVIALMLMIAAPARAQVDQGRFSGTVRDQSNAFVGGARVKVTNERTGEERVVLTNPEGYFLVGSLKPSTYTIRAEKDGFSVIEYTGMALAVGQELSLDFEFKPAGVQEAVTVVGTAPVVDLSSAKVGANVTEREVQGLPVNGRQMSQLMLQAPGSQNAGTGTWGEIRFSGRAVEQNVIKYDGVEGSGIIDAAPGVANGENNGLFKLQSSLENVQEFRVESSNYPAEFGTGTGGQISVITKSGANQFRGSVFEYLRNDALDAANYFDSFRNADGSVSAGVGSAPTVPKSPLSLNQFGGSIGGPIAKNRAFFFGSYEGYRLDAGKNIIQGVPSAAAWARAVPAVLPLRSGFAAPDAHVLVGASTNPDVDVMQWQATQNVQENAFAARLDFKISNNWSTYVRVFHDQANSIDPQDLSGRFFKMTINPTNAIFNLQGILGSGAVNEFKFGYNGAPSTEGAQTQPGFENFALSLTQNTTLASVAGATSAGLVSPGGLVGVNSQGNGRGAPYDPYSLTLADTLSSVKGNHYIKFGADVRMIRMTTDQLGGTTYTYANLNAFLANTPSTILYFGDLSEPSPFHNGATGEKHTKQEYYVGFAQDEWRASKNVTLNYGLRYDYYVPLTEVDNRVVKVNIVTGQIDPDTTPFYQSKKTNFQPRASVAYSPTPKTVFKVGAGIFVGPGQTEDQIQPIEAERISTSLTSGPFLAYPIDPALIRLNFTNNPNNRSYAPRAYSNDYTLPEKVYQYTASIQQELASRLSASVTYVGSQGRNLFLRSVTNQIVGVQTTGGGTGSLTVREFSIVTCANGTVGTGTMCPGSTVASVQNPYGEIDYKTSGGSDSYNAMQVAVSRRSTNGLALNAQYTLGYSKGDSGGSNEARTAGNNASFASERPANRVNPADFSYEDGYNQFDVRHTLNISALYSTQGKNWLTGGWMFGGIANARSGLPIEVRIARPDIAFVDAAGNVFGAAGAGRTAVVNTPGGGNTRNFRRPDLVPGVDPFLSNGGLIFLNPAAFTTPAPGTNGNLERNSLHGPNFWQVDAVVAKRIGAASKINGELRLEIFNIFNRTNLSSTNGFNAVLPNALPTTAVTQANTVQPGQPYTAGAAGTFGRFTQTVGTTVGIGTSRQIQLAFRFNF